MYVVGKVLKPQGIKGEVKIEIITSFPDHLFSLKELFVDFDGEWRSFSVEHVRRAQSTAFIKFAGIRTRDEAEQLRDKYLHIPQEQLMEPPEDHFYVHDLIGMPVFDESDRLLGEITDVKSFPANDVYVMQTTDNRECMIPAVQDIVISVRTSPKKMVIRLIEGLLD